MKAFQQENIRESSRSRLYALSPDYRPELKPGHLLCDQSLPVEERIQLAQAETIRVLNKLRPLGEAGDTRSQIEFAKEAKLLQWLCQPAAAEWVEEKYPQRAKILLKYKFELLEDGFVRFTLPEGTSYLDLFEEANRYCKENGRKRGAVVNWAMHQFAQRADATSKIGCSQTHEIQGLVPGSTGKGRAEQEKLLHDRGLSFASLEVAAAAAALYYCATGKDLLDDKYVRTAVTGLELGSCAHGLYGHGFGRDDCRADDVGAAGTRNLT